jgi:hypothetical protein
VQDGEPEVLGLGVLSPEGRQDLHLVQLEAPSFYRSEGAFLSVEERQTILLFENLSK